MHKFSVILLWVGGLNWGLVGLGSFMNSNWNVVGLLGMTLSNLIYILVGIAAVYELVTHKKNCKYCEKKMDNQPV